MLESSLCGRHPLRGGAHRRRAGGSPLCTSVHWPVLGWSGGITTCFTRTSPPRSAGWLLACGSSSPCSFSPSSTSFGKGASSVLEQDHRWGSLHFQLGPILAFPITVWASFLLSRFVRFALEEEVYPNLPLGRGIPYAASTVVHYTILFVGFVVAVKAAGAHLSQLTFLLGALGVGLGFGLQNILNNFVSGIILLFERPIKVGDIVQIDTNIGKVERIGIRASVILLTNGSELIVPNGNLISNPVTNWTLSQLRAADRDSGSMSPRRSIPSTSSISSPARPGRMAACSRIRLRRRCWPRSARC